jgi:hypothetical protein
VRFTRLDRERDVVEDGGAKNRSTRTPSFFHTFFISALSKAKLPFSAELRPFERYVVQRRGENFSISRDYPPYYPPIMCSNNL